MKKIEYRCPSCGSNEVLQDAFVDMNTEEVSTFDDKTCNQCGKHFHTAAEVEIDVPDEEVLEFYAVSGRICGDDEDTTLVIKAASRQAALDEYTETMWSLDGTPQADRELLEANGEGVFINSVVKSKTAIVEV